MKKRLWHRPENIRGADSYGFWRHGNLQLLLILSRNKPWNRFPLEELEEL